MPQLTESAAALLPPAQAAELLRVVDLEAEWQNLRDDPPAADPSSAARLRRLQAAFEGYRSRAAGYATRFRTDRVPELTPSGPDRLAAWCRTVRTLLGLAAGEPGVSADHVVRKAYRMADRIATRVGAEPVGREPGPGAAAELDAVILWCDGQTAADADPKRET